MVILIFVSLIYSELQYEPEYNVSGIFLPVYSFVVLLYSCLQPHGSVKHQPTLFNECI